MSSTLTKKQLEIQRRQQDVLQIARQIFCARGYLGLNMDRIAQRMGVAKGTIYQHYSCKEDIILALAVETLGRRTAMFEKAAVFNGNSRDRMTAIGCAAELFVKWYPDHFELEKVLSCGSIIEKTSGKLQLAKNAVETKCISLVAGIVRDGLSQGDLVQGDWTPDELVFGLWSNTFGGYSIMDNEMTMSQMGIEDGFKIVRSNNFRLLDGYGWQPFSTDVDYNQIFEKIEREIFSDGPIQ